MKIYLACPYTQNPERGFIQANRKAAELMLEGHIVFSPISHSHHICIQNGLPEKLDFWLKQDLPFIDWCDELHVLMLPGWEDSSGVSREIEYAELTFKPVQMSDYGAVGR